VFECPFTVGLARLIGEGSWVFVFDVTVFSQTAEECAEQLAHILERCRRVSLN